MLLLRPCAAAARCDLLARRKPHLRASLAGLATRVATSPDLLAHEFVYGTSDDSGDDAHDSSTMVLLHGLFGSRKNFKGFGKALCLEAEARGIRRPRVLLVDLRCHGDNAPFDPPHDVQSAAADVARLLSSLSIAPRAVVGHSLGGKVALGLCEHLSPPNTVVLDMVPGTRLGDNEASARGGSAAPADVSGEGGTGTDSVDTIGFFLEALDDLRRRPISSKRDFVAELEARGFVPAIANWMGMNVVG